jgi:hypothetical protein
MLPENAPNKYFERVNLWNAVEKAEQACNAQLAREIELALPRELTEAQNISLLRYYCRKNFTAEGMCADIAIHDKKDGNPHAHIMLTMRPINKDKSWGIKERKGYALDENNERIPIIDPKTGTQKVDSRNRKQWKREYVQVNDWNFRGNAEVWRENWSEAVNKFLEQKNINERVDHRSFKRQGKEEHPTIHLGVAAHRMEQKGIPTERGNHNRKVKNFNNELQQLKAQIYKLESWLRKETAKPETPTLPPLYDVVQNILNRQAQKGKSQHYQNINNLKSFAKMMNFLSENKIQDFNELKEKLHSMISNQREIAQDLKPIERRLKTLDEHIIQGENYRKYKSIYEKYNSIQPNFTDKIFKRDPKAEFYNQNSAEIILFEAADRYLKAHLNSKVKTPPLKKWKAKREEKTAEKDKLYQNYYTLKNEVKEVEQIKRSVYDILQRENQQQQRNRTHGMEL